MRVRPMQSRPRTCSSKTDTNTRMSPGHNMTSKKSATHFALVITISATIILAVTPAAHSVHHHNSQRWSRQVQNPNGFIVGSDWVPVQQFPTTRSVVPLAQADRQSAARVLNFAPPHLQPQNPYFPQHLLQQPQQHQQPHLNAIESRPQPQHLPPFASSADPFQLVAGGPHRFHLQQSPAVQFNGNQPAPISQQTQQFYQSQGASLPQYHFVQQQQQQQQPAAPHQHQPPAQHHQVAHQQPLPQHQALVLNPAELNNQYQYPQFVQQQQQQLQHQESIQLQAQPLQHVLQQQQYEVQQTAQPAFTRHEQSAAVEAGHRKPHTEPLIQRAPQLYGQEQAPKVRQNAVTEPQSEEEVQLLYVPLDTLYKQQTEQRQQAAQAAHQATSKPKQSAPSQNIKYNVQPVNPLQINNFYTATPSTIRPSIQSPTAATYSVSPAYVFEGSTQRYVQKQQQTPVTTPAPKPKVKPHQPPLAMFMINGVSNSDLSVNEVLHALKNARNIDVLDSASKKAPKVFVGPSGLRTPNGYSKFELPYLSSIEQNRGVNKLPFFVAPLSYKAPKGFAKIPLPAPHVGSVVINSPPDVVQYEPIELPVQQQQSQPSRGQNYPKKVQSVLASAAPPAVQGLEAYRTTSKPTKYGFMLGRDVFTTTVRPYQAPTATPSTTAANGNRYQFVSSTLSPSAEQYSRFPEFSTTNVRNPLSTLAPSPNDHSQRYQVSASLATSDEDGFVPMTTQKTSSGRYESFGRFGQRGTPATTRAPVVSQTPSTRIPFNYEQFARPSAQPTLPTYTSQQPEKDYTRFTSGPSSRSPTKLPLPSSVQPTLSTYSAQQHEEEYSRFSTPSSSPASPIKSNDASNLHGFKQNPTPTTSNVQTEEYFNVQKSPQVESFATPNKTHTFATNLYNQFHPSKDYFSVPQVTSSDSTASAPRPTESENYSFVPLITPKPATPRPDVTYTAKPAEHSTRAQEIYQMKNYFREQTAFKSRPQLQSVAGSSGEEAEELTSDVRRPSYSSFERNQPSSTPQYVYMRSSTSTTTTTESPVETANPTETNFIDRSTPRNTITYYTPSSAHAEDSPKGVHHFKYVHSVTDEPEREQQSHREVFRTDASTETSAQRDEKRIYSNHRESYSDPLPTPKVRLYDYDRSTASTPVSHSYDYSSTTGHTSSDEYNTLIRDAIKQNQASDDELNAQITYNLPSELPPISASLPGMVNSLFVDTNTEPGLHEQATTLEPSTVSTRRTPHRGRRPQTQTNRATATRAPVTRAPRTTTSTTPSPDYGNADYVASTRRTTVRGRRPIHYANRTTTPRTPTVRNPNRVRYNPTSEERQRVRNKQKTGGKDEDLDYQRDVLKQNYPTITRASTTAVPVSTEAERSTRYTTAVSMVHETERYSSHYRAPINSPANDDVSDDSYYHQAPSSTPATPYVSADAVEIISSSTARSAYDDLPEHFSGLADQMQIPQEHQSLIGEYYNSESDISAADVINNGRRANENRPVFLTTPSTSTTEEIQAIQENAIEPQRTRRPNFVRRPVTGGSRPIYNGGSSTESVERYTVRPKVRNDPNNAGIYTPKPRNSRVRVRGSTTTTSTTTTAEPELSGTSNSEEPEQSYQQISRFNKDFYQDAPRHRNFQRPSAKSGRNNEQKRFKYESFALDTQESQWSTKISENSFRPVEEDSPKTAKALKPSNFVDRDDEPDIVTAGPETTGEGNGETYLLKVSASLGGKSSQSTTTTTTTTTTTPSPSDVKSFADLLGEAMSDLGNEIISKPKEIIETEEHTEEVAAVTTIASVADSASDASNVAISSSSSVSNGNKRRGAWKRVRVRPADGFETAESQNYGTRIFNSIAAAENAKDQLRKETKKTSFGSGSFHSFNLDDIVDESESPRNPSELPTNMPVATASSPGDVDLGTGAPILSTLPVVENNPNMDITTFSRNIETTPQPHSIDETETESVKSMDETPYTTITSTRRYDIDEDDLMMEDDDHTEFPFTYETFGEHTDLNEAEFKTDAPEQPTTSEQPFYDDYAEVVQHTSPTALVQKPQESLAATMPPKRNQADPAPPASTTSSLMSDVKQKLSELFSFGADYDYSEANSVQPTIRPAVRQQYTTISRVRPTPEIQTVPSQDSQVKPLTENPQNAEPSPVEATASTSTTKSFHRNLMDSVIYATSTSTEVSHETEICYRGRCIKTEKKLH